MSSESLRHNLSERSKEYPLSWFQERLWLLHKKNPRDVSYNIPVAFAIEGDLDVEALRLSLQAIVHRHESLRTRYLTSRRGVAVQIVDEPAELVLEAIDAQAAETERYVDENALHLFDLEKGPVFVAKLLKLGPTKHLLLVNVHHVAADGWSIEGILFSELQVGYCAFSRGTTPDLPPLRGSYTTFSLWQRKQDFAAPLAHFQSELEGYEDSLELPADYIRKSQPGLTSERIVLKYSREFSRELEQFAQANGCTLFMALLAGLGVVLGHYTGRDDVCIGTTTSGRTQPEWEPLIGFFINILPLRIQIESGESVRAYVSRVRSLTLKGFENQAVPFERILYSLGLERSGRANPLVPVVLRHQNFPHSSLDADLPGNVKFKSVGADADGESASTSTIRNVATRCEVELSYTGDGTSLEVEAIFDPQLYRRDSIERLLSHHEQILRAMFSDGAKAIQELQLLCPAELMRLGGWNPAFPETPLGSSNFVARFEAVCQTAPSSIACYDQAGPSTYAKVSEDSNRLANYLLARGVRAGDVVGVCMTRQTSLLVSLLAVWKAGAAYVPLDPTYPDAYLRQILADARPTKCICLSEHRSKLGLKVDEAVLIDGDADTIAASAPVLPSDGSNLDTLAYIMYTSGSTGTPKGVRVPHRQLVNWFEGLQRMCPFEPGEVVAQKTTFAFAVSVKEIFLGLLSQAPMVFLDAHIVQDVRAFVDAMNEYRVTRVNLVPSHLRAVLEHLEREGLKLPSLRLCTTAGEPLTSELVESFRALLPGVRLLNNYGCTELNDVCYFDATQFQTQGSFVPIGKPIQNTRLFVLDRVGRLVPEGVPGELHVASLGMPEGYHNLSTLTEERFRSNPFDPTGGTELYNTGDVVKYLPDGNLEYFGRWDTQVKIRGFRVDVRQVEKVMGDFPGLGLRAVVAHGEQLAAYYVVPEGRTIDSGALRSFLQVHLPSHFVPSLYIALQAMPRLPNGKLDRLALSPSLGQVQRSHDYEAPRPGTERQIAAIWSEVLEVAEDEVGRLTDFFEIGGHSLSATRVAARIKERFGVELGLGALFENPTLSMLGARLDQVLKDISHLDDDVSGLPWVGRRTPEEAHAAYGLLTGRVALVTGSSRGIGSATVRLLAAQGAKVAINYVHSRARALRVKELIESDGGTAEVFQADVTDVTETSRLVADVQDCFGPIDVLVANAAIGFKIQPFIEYSWEDFSKKVTDELKSLYFLCQAVVPGMLERKSGSIIAVSSTMSKEANDGFVAHSAAKAAVDAFVRSLALELGESGVRANTVAPGLTLTDATANLSFQRKDSAAARCPMRRNGLPKDVAGAILFLASDLSQFMTGAYLPVDGGFTML